ncbi:MAG: hypothetical protein R3240_08760, partial [Gammaproteobacteria bacterium]|nr:hypothetical protein [Gammaproteobacteria bacterium]
MKFTGIKTATAIGLLLSSGLLIGCVDNSTESTDNPDNTPQTTSTAKVGTAAYVAENNELKGDFTESVTLDANKVYKITGEVNFTEGTTLTIPAGTTLYGATASSYLAINAGAMIDA